jgi:hypothetical protein
VTWIRAPIPDGTITSYVTCSPARQGSSLKSTIVAPEAAALMSVFAVRR